MKTNGQWTMDFLFNLYFKWGGWEWQKQMQIKLKSCLIQMKLEYSWGKGYDLSIVGVWLIVNLSKSPHLHVNFHEFFIEDLRNKL